MTVVDGLVSLPPEAATWLRDGATIVSSDHAVFRVEGPGALDCVQGVLTNDVVRPGAGSLVYGAMLTPKGMIVADLWAIRPGAVADEGKDAESLTLVVPPAGRDAAVALFQAQFPPRLARVVELTPRWGTHWLIGARVETVLRDAGVGLPTAEGHAVLVKRGERQDEAGGKEEGENGRSVILGRGHASSPWWALAVGPRTEIDGLSSDFQAAGALSGGVEHLEAARILAGWPALGREIGEKTLPQEVRYDEIGGVSYTKGCYVGQETVARVHFRGHPNRHLRGLVWDGEGVSPGQAVSAGERDVGRLGSVLEVGTRHYGLAVIRREVEDGAIVTVGRIATARVSELPFTL